MGNICHGGVIDRPVLSLFPGFRSSPYTSPLITPYISRAGSLNDVMSFSPGQRAPRAVPTLAEAVLKTFLFLSILEL